jgi:hypothetical protein
MDGAEQDARKLEEVAMEAVNQTLRTEPQMGVLIGMASTVAVKQSSPVQFSKEIKAICPWCAMRVVIEIGSGQARLGRSMFLAGEFVLQAKEVFSAEIVQEHESLDSHPKAFRIPARAASRPDETSLILVVS